MPPLYPDLNDIRRCSEGYEKQPQGGALISENCGKILARGPAITKDILEKMQHSELGPKKTRLCGRDCVTRKVWVLSGLSIIFLVAFVGTVITWCTGVFDKVILSQIVLRNGTEGYNAWKNPPAKPLVKVFLFNYTNVEEFERGEAKKLNVEELGPYVYEATLERLNIRFNENGTLSYQESRKYRFIPEMSNGRRQSDRLIVPNMPMLGAAARGKHSYYLSRLGLSSLLKGLNSKPFLSLPAHRFIWGYDDNLYTLAKGILALKNEMLYERFGILSNKLGVSKDVVTIFTGEKGFDKLGMIDKYNGKSKIGQWSTEECDAIKASDGTIFAPALIRNRKNIAMYHKDFCRTLPLVFQKEIKLFKRKVPAYRYVLPENIFDTPEKNFENQCYCDMNSGECPPQGVFNSTPCAFGAPAFISFPHFYNGDPELTEAVTGLNPNPKNHETYIDIHPKYGFAMSGQMRVQMNIQIIKSFGITQLDMFEDGLMLPVAWLETGLYPEEVSEEGLDLIYLTTFTTQNVETALKWTCLLTCFIITVMLTIELKNRWQQRKRTNSNSSMTRLQHVSEI